MQCRDTVVAGVRKLSHQGWSDLGQGLGLALPRCEACLFHIMQIGGAVTGQVCRIEGGIAGGKIEVEPFVQGVGLEGSCVQFKVQHMAPSGTVIGEEVQMVTGNIHALDE